MVRRCFELRSQHDRLSEIGNTLLEDVAEACHSEPERSAGEESQDPQRWLVRRCFELRPQHDRLFEIGNTLLEPVRTAEQAAEG